MKRNADRENTTSRIVMATLCLATIFIVFLFLHLLNVRGLFFDMGKEALLGQLDTGNAVAQKEVDRLKSMTAECEEKLLAITKGQSINMVLADEQKDNPGYEYAYLGDDAVLLTPTMKMQSSETQAIIDDVYSFDFHNDFICVTTQGVNKGVKQVQWMGIRRVSLTEDSTGYVLVSTPIDNIFQEEVFDYLTEQASCCLINKSGKLLVSEKDFSEEIGAGDNFFQALKEHDKQSIGADSKIDELRGMLNSQDKGSVTLSFDNGKKCFITFQKVYGTKETFLVACFHNDVLNSMVDKVLSRSVLFGVILFLIIIGVFFYTWKSEMKSGALIAKLAYEDPVTGGRNLNYFKIHAGEIISENREYRFCIYRFDILRFRYINEAYGHIRADQVLQTCVEEFQKIYGPKELCVRINSDQFLALVTNDNTVEQRYQSYLKAVGERAREFGVKYPIRLRLGIYKVRKDDSDIDIMIDHANAARKSLHGEDKVLEAVYSDGIVAGMKRVNDIESIMQQSLSEGEFRIYLQPKWSIKDDCLVGAEALARWVRKDGTVIYPGDFIPVFENNGFIEKLDYYMLEKLCMYMREYRREKIYKNIKISINQSRILILNPDYVKNVEKLVSKYEIPVEHLELEITETVFFDEREKMIEIVKSLKNIGIYLAMDDFGSGYSSLNLLKDVPFDVLKIDREFFSETETSEASILILEKIVEMAKALGIYVICEGVETAKQVEVLRKLGCELVQGYYYGRPIPLEEFYEKYCRCEDEEDELSTTAGGDTATGADPGEKTASA